MNGIQYEKLRLVDDFLALIFSYENAQGLLRKNL